MTVSTECWMRACRQCGDPNCDHDCHITRLQDPPELPAPAVAPTAASLPLSAVGPEEAAVGGATGSPKAEGKPAAGVRGPAAPGASVAVAAEKQPLCSSEATTGVTNPFPRAFWSDECRFVGRDGHVCRTSFGMPLEPGQTCFSEARSSLLEDMARFRAVAG